ncbi:hypothetical protein FS837_012741 [Tulasnella sp. UAMH 9824]|nr:hypothetical protein FS837_012741 [Tulasnella sp. UAMH 9824]
MDRLIPWPCKTGNSTISGAATAGGENDSEEVEERSDSQESVIVCEVVEVPSAFEDQPPYSQLPLDNIRTGLSLEGPHEGIPGFSRGSFPASGRVLLKRPCTTYRTVDRENVVWREVPRHPHILMFLGACKVTRQWYYAVPYYPNLSPMLVYLHTDPEADRGALVLQVCDALKALHSSNIVHGHLGITHLLVSDKRALLYDFCKSRTHQDKGFEQDVFDLGITIAEILKGKRYSRWKIRLLRKYPRQPPWGSSIRASYGSVWDMATYCWSPNPAFRPTVPQVLESLSKSLGLVRVTEPPVSGFDAVLGDRPPLELPSSAPAVPHPVPPPEPPTQLTAQNQAVHPPRVPSAPIPRRLMPPPEASGDWIECAPYEFFNLPVRRYRRLQGIPHASGGFSDVYKCETTYSDGDRQLVSMPFVLNLRGLKFKLPCDKVAEKVLRAARLCETGKIFFKCLQKLIQEVTIWGNLRHPCIAPLMGFTLQPSISLISPWYKNGSVQHYIRSLRLRNQDCDRLKLLHEVAQGLTYLHEFTPPVVHGDIKPDNILIDDNGSALIIDFGLSRSLVESIPGFISSNRGAGNVRWMAPELIDGTLSKSLAGDVYSFGCLAMNILNGSIPFKDFVKDAALIKALLGRTPPSPASTRQKISCNPALETPVWKLLDQCWATDPADRPTMRDIEGRVQKLGRLEAALAEAHGVSNPPVPTGNEDKAVSAKQKMRHEQLDILLEMLNQATDEKPPPGAPPSSSLPFLVVS